MIEEDIIPSIINGRGTEEFIATSIIHTDNDTIEHEWNNSESTSKYKITFTSKNYLYNNNVEHKSELQYSKID